MAGTSGERFTVRIGGDASGPVVVGHDIRVEVHEAKPGTPAAQEDEAPGSTQTNTAEDHATINSVMHGEQHIHHHYNDAGNGPGR
ncbi:hypothetical protein [Embleya sp. NPDC005575]|uniref:hypothetical protein n=1 Tax=Embleya sp. NPDC005575 TaxID=3156892 RepID=UPI0033B5CFEB